MSDQHTKFTADTGMAEPATLLHVPPAVLAGILPPKCVRVSYQPQPDITAYELATILPFFHGKMMTEADWTALGATQRHISRHD